MRSEEEMERRIGSQPVVSRVRLMAARSKWHSLLSNENPCRLRAVSSSVCRSCE